MIASMIPNPHEYRYRHLPTDVIATEIELARWDLASVMTDAETGKTNLSSVDFAVTAVNDLEAEYARRVRLRFHPEAPAWPAKDEARIAALRELAARLKDAWPLERFCREMLLMDLRRSGDKLIGRCPSPAHDDKTPSFVIYPDDHAHCFGCHLNGDVYDLIGQLQGLDTFTARVRVLAEISGVPVETAAAYGR